ncbi:hypothetical protein P9139_12725 [Curtobacterium flaccumfaciens]|nr:hypothetical protein P9139_12725 [Curtobacterium flaccumfaciens]
MDLAPGVRDLRVVVPVVAAWVSAAVLVGAPGSAGWVAPVAGIVVCGGLGVIGFVRGGRPGWSPGWGSWWRSCRSARWSRSR